MTKRFGFTLAEVLITLGIIGVVAAMTMPTLINQTNGAQYKAAYKKALSAISQGVTLNVALDDVSFADTTAASSDTSGDTSIAGFLRNRMNVVKSVAGSTGNYNIQLATGGATVSSTATDIGAGDNVTLYFNDSSVFSFKKVAGSDATTNRCTADNPCKGVIDVNGQKGPNKEVTCANSNGACTGDITVTDIYPVKFYDQTILPNSPAARGVLYGK